MNYSIAARAKSPKASRHKRNGDSAQVAKEASEDGEAGNLQTREKVQQMSKDALLLKQTITLMMEKFKVLETDLKKFELEQQKQRMINDHLLNQLIGSK